MLTNFGPKIYFFRLPEVNKTHDEHFQDLKGDQFTVKFQRMKEAMNKYLDIFESCPTAEAEEGLQYYLPKILLDKFRINDSDDTLHIIVNLGMLLRRLRAVAWTREYGSSTKKTTQEGETIETEERDYAFNTNLFEDQSRADRQHYNLALAHALSMGRTSVGIEDMPLVVRVTLSTAPLNRHKVFDKLLDLGGSITTKEIQDNLHLHRSTAKKTMTELVAVGLVHWETTGQEHSDTIVLEDEFNWFTGTEFEAVRDDSYPRYREYVENLKEVKPSPVPQDLDDQQKGA